MDEMYGLLQIQQQKYEIQKIIACNNITNKYGLALTEEEVKTLMVCRKNSLKKNQRIEFGEGILANIIYAFCDSQYLNQDNYIDTLVQLQEIFYLYKNECMDEVTDTELIDFMRKQFEEICFGDLEYLEGTCLERFAKAIRCGHSFQSQHGLQDEYELKDAENEYNKLSEETRWEYEIYKTKLDNMD